jgi:hypothetical protein
MSLPKSFWYSASDASDRYICFRLRNSGLNLCGIESGVSVLIVG